MVAHGIAQILKGELLVGDDPESHLLGILLDTGSVRHILGEIVAETVEEAPHAGLAVTAAREVGSGVGGIVAEVGILTLKPTHVAGIAHHIVRADHQIGHGLLAIDGIFLQQILHLHLHVTAIEELRDTALVSVGSNGIVGDADSHPNGAACLLRAVGAAAHHFKHPRLILISHRERLALGIIAVLSHQRCHDLQGLTSCLRTLEGDVNERAVVDDTCGVGHFLTASEGGLTDGYLPLVAIADHIISLWRLSNLTQILVCVPLEHFPHLTSLMPGSRIVVEGHEGTV